MANGAWSNDQLNQIFVYDAATGTLILRVDSTGLYYYNVTNGSYFKVGVDTQDTSNNVAIFVQPGNSAIPGVTWSAPGEIIGGEVINGAETSGEIVLLSPQIGTKVRGQINILGQDSSSVTDDSEIDLLAADLFGNQFNVIGQGTVDDGANYTTNNFSSTTEVAADWAGETYGTMVTSRFYEGRWTGTVQSSTAGDRVGLRLYTGPSKTSLAGSTLLFDYGQITIAAANTPQPFFVDTEFGGVPGQFLLLGARRASGSGTCFLNIGMRKIIDLVPA